LTGSELKKNQEKGRWLIFLYCSGLVILSFMYRAANAVIAVDLSRDLHLTPQDFGLLGAMFFYVNMLTQFPLGQCLDRFGPLRSIMVVNFFGLAGLILFSQADGLTVGLIGRGLIGGSMAVNLVGSLVLLLNLFPPDKFATISGLLISAGSIGNLLATSPLRFLTDAVGWRTSFLIMAGLHLLLMIGLWVSVKRADLHHSTYDTSPLPESRRPGVIRAYRILLKNPSFWVLSLSIGLSYGALSAIQALWGGPFLIVYLGLSPHLSSHLLLLLGLGVIFGAAGTGAISDRLQSRKKVVLPGLMGAALSALMLCNWPGTVFLPLLAGLLFLMGFFFGAGALFYVHIKELMPASLSGTAMSGISFFTSLGAAVFMQGLGNIIGRGTVGSLEAGGDYYKAFLICFFGLVGATIIYGFSRDTQTVSKSH
jgi:predicted MFS family arabinose efflux permease